MTPRVIKLFQFYILCTNIISLYRKGAYNQAPFGIYARGIEINY